MYKNFVWIVIVLAAGVWIGRSTAPDPNAVPTYGKTGFPKNCRAIIQTNLEAWAAKQYSASDIFLSLDRNCGANGYAWGQ